MLRLLWLSLLLVPSLQAEVLRIPIGQQGSVQALSLPQFGEKQITVLERFGLADQEHPAVGQPAIVRWDYRNFSVYFESGVVINSVQHHQPHSLPQDHAQ